MGGPSAGGSGPGNLLGRAGEWRSGPGASHWALRERVLGRARGEAGLRGEVGRAGLSFGFGLGWVEFWVWVMGSFSISIYSLFCISNSNKV